MAGEMLQFYIETKLMWKRVSWFASKFTYLVPRKLSKPDSKYIVAAAKLSWLQLRILKSLVSMYCCNIFFLINGGVHWVKRYYKNVLESYHCPRQDSNLQSPDPKSGALSIGPQGLFDILILNILFQYHKYFNQAWNSGFTNSWKTNIFDECGVMTSVNWPT